MNHTPTLSLEVLRHFDNEAIFHMIEAGVCKEVETIAAGRAVHGKWIDGAQAAAFRARRAMAGVIVALSAMSAHAMDAEDTAKTAAVADGVSTAVVIGTGAAVEANPMINASPIGLLGVTALKYAIPAMVKDAEPATRKTVLVSASGIYGGAAVNNLLILAGAGPVAIVGGIVAGIWFAINTADKVDAEIAAAAQPVAVVAAE